MDSIGELKIFAGSTATGLAGEICRELHVLPGESETLTFSEGNTFVRIGETVRGKDVYLIQSIGLHPNDEFVETLFWLDAFKRASASSVTLVMPYFGYAKGDKKDEPRVSIRARVCAECMELAGVDRVVTMDLHSPQIQGFFRRPVDHLIAMPMICDYIQSLALEDLVVVSPDSGFAKQARRFASRLGASVAIGDKMRVSHDENAEVLDIVGNVEGKNCLIVDDFSISGGTLVDVARVLRERGAKRIIAALSHVLLNDKAAARVEHSDIEMLIATNSVPNPHVRSMSKFHSLSIAPLLANTILRIHNRDSVSALFD